MGANEATAANKLEAKFITLPKEHAVVFSFVTLVADDTKYERMLASLELKGFNATNSEIIALDNRSHNNFDGFSYLRRALLDARGEFIVLTHDDIELTSDGYDELLTTLRDLSKFDPRWGVAGNAGCNRSGELLLHIHDPHGTWSIDKPQLCESVDENLMIVRRDNLVLGSLDLDGFHLYGPDLCLQAELQGATTYVVPFMLRHHSGGKKSAEFFASRDRFADKYGTLFRHRMYSTTNGEIYLGGQSWFKKIENVFLDLTMRTLRKLRLN